MKKLVQRLLVLVSGSCLLWWAHYGFPTVSNVVATSEPAKTASNGLGFWSIMTLSGLGLIILLVVFIALIPKFTEEKDDDNTEGAELKAKKADTEDPRPKKKWTWSKVGEITFVSTSAMLGIYLIIYQIFPSIFPSWQKHIDFSASLPLGVHLLTIGLVIALLLYTKWQVFFGPKRTAMFGLAIVLIILWVIAFSYRSISWGSVGGLSSRSSGTLPSWEWDVAKIRPAVYLAFGALSFAIWWFVDRPKKEKWLARGIWLVFVLPFLPLFLLAIVSFVSRPTPSHWMTSGPGVTMASIGGASAASGEQEFETPADGSWSEWYKVDTSVYHEWKWDRPAWVQLYLNGKPAEKFLDGPGIDTSELWAGEHHTRKIVIFRIQSYEGKRARIIIAARPYNPFEKAVRSVTPVDVP